MVFWMEYDVECLILFHLFFRSALVLTFFYYISFKSIVIQKTDFCFSMFVGDVRIAQVMQCIILAMAS